MPFEFKIAHVIFWSVRRHHQQIANKTGVQTLKTNIKLYVHDTVCFYFIFSDTWHRRRQTNWWLSFPTVEPYTVLYVTPYLPNKVQVILIRPNITRLISHLFCCWVEYYFRIKATSNFQGMLDLGFIIISILLITCTCNNLGELIHYIISIRAILVVEFWSSSHCKP